MSFEYVRSWLDDPGAFALDPGLPLVQGETFSPEGRLPAILDDTAPDRWGRRLLDRREAHNARHEDRAARNLGEWDYLLGVTDETRMGAVRLSEGPEGPFLDDQDPSVPPLAHLRTLEFAAREIEYGRDVAAIDAAVAMLLAPGSSLGGARPKANFVDTHGSLWIAKFPSLDDRRDVGAWEFVLNRLASVAAIRVPEAQNLKLSANGTTFAVRRFDREARRRRLYASAMTLTGKHDGEDASYLDLAQAIADYVAPTAIEADLRELFRRLVFNILVGNRDDHLRNHGFLRAPEGWRLSPAFDLNTVPEATEHSLALDDVSHAPDIATALATAAFYRLSNNQASGIVSEVSDAITQWRSIAREIDLGPDEVARLAAHLDQAASALA
jgi:serine/threonine-protein kinase HipA